MRNNFQPVHLQNANAKLNKHILSAHVHKQTNDGYKKSVFKEPLWKKFLGLFKKKS